jgi:hypothetical protein
LAGRTVLVHADGGQGDTLQFARYLPLVAAQGGRVILECQKSLRRLLEALPCVAQVVGEGEPLPAHDCHVPLLSLPLVLGTQLTTIPAEVPYVSATTRSGRMPILPSQDGLRVGVVWGGESPSAHQRPLSLEALAPLLAAEGISWYSLQLGEQACQLIQVPAAAGVRNLGPLIRDIVDAAALVSQLDLLITVDAAIAHLAGALGLNVWVLLPYAPGWCWCSPDGGSKWYPTARLFRQPRPGDWDGVVEAVRGALSEAPAAGGDPG